MGRIHKEYYSASARYLSNEAIREIKGSMGSVPDAINAMAKKYRINYYRVLDYIENRERKQQIIQNTVSNQIESEVLLQSKPLGNGLEIRGSASSLNHDSSNLHLEPNTLSNKEIKKKSSKSSSKPITKSVHISDPIPTSYIVSTIDNNSIEEICSDDLGALCKREAKIDEKNKRNLTCLLAS
ncbi:hypothetical protein Glove_135g71 [Diversispora epigaea]|uniref:Uncharacterized protein n=1 Tax=Diversispora epigaea TaxID=1348612 RepID=A0A397J5G6_9GLOM|nr:hypothetical protein Glove_135g71 [Diversispora epigaea]